MDRQRQVGECRRQVGRQVSKQEKQACGYSRWGGVLPWSQRVAATFIGFLLRGDENSMLCYSVLCCAAVLYCGTPEDCFGDGESRFRASR